MLMPWSVFDKLTKMWSTVLKQYWQYHIWQTSALLQPRSPSLNICFCLKCVCSENEWEKSPFLVFDDKCESWEQSRARWKILRACISGNCHNCQQHWGGICNSRKTSENKSHHISQKKRYILGTLYDFWRTRKEVLWWDLFSFRETPSSAGTSKDNRHLCKLCQADIRLEVFVPKIPVK